MLTAIGPAGRGPTTVQTDSTAAIVAAMRQTGVRRVLRHGFADMRGGMQVSRADVAACVLRSLTEPSWVRAAVSVSA